MLKWLKMIKEIVKESTVKDFSILLLIIHHKYTVLFPWHISHIVKYVSVRRVLFALNEIFVHLHSCVSNRWRSSFVMWSISLWFFGLIIVKTWGCPIQPCVHFHAEHCIIVGVLFSVIFFMFFTIVPPPYCCTCTGPLTDVAA